MKQILVWVLVLALGLSACGTAAPDTTAAVLPSVPAPSAPVPTTLPATEPETMPEVSTEPTLVPVPLLAQQDYPVAYGAGNVPEGGCGIVCLAMVLTALLGEPVSPEDLAARYGASTAPPERTGPCFPLLPPTSASPAHSPSTPMRCWTHWKRESL